MTHPRASSAHAGMLLWALIVGVSYPAVGLLTDGLPPLLLTALRFAIAAVSMLPLIWQAGRQLPALPGILLYAILGLCLAGFFGTMFWAAHRVTALTMAAFSVSVPLLAYGFGRALGVEAPAYRLLGTFTLGTIGALSLIFAQGAGDAADLRIGWNEGAFFLGCVALALYPVLSKWGLVRGILSRDAAVRTFWSLFVGAILIAAIGLIYEPITALSQMRFEDVLLVVYLGVFSSGATFWLLQRGTGALTPGTVTAYNYLVPFVAMLVLFATQTDVIGWHWLPGSLLVMVAMLLLVRE